MGGGISPFEYILPPVALAHAGYNAAAQQISPRAKLNTPTSPNAKEASAEEDQLKAEADQRAANDKSAADYLAANPLPQTADEEMASRRRAAVAGAGKLGGKRPSQYLAGGESVLGNTV